MSRVARVQLAALLPLALAVRAAAVPLPPDTNAEPSGLAPPPGVRIDSGTIPFEVPGGESLNGVATGVIDYEVVREATDLLRFEFVVTNHPGSDFDLQEFATSSHEGYTVDADVEDASPGDATPQSVGRNHLGGPRVSFSFGEGGTIEPGQSSRTLYVRSNAIGYDKDGTIRLRRGPASIDIPHVGPQPMPEPNGTAAALLALWMLRRSRPGVRRFAAPRRGRGSLWAGMLLLVALLPLRAGAASCPSYFNAIDPTKCNGNGFCGWFDLETSTLHEGVFEKDDPSAEVATFPEPWSASRNATIGSGDFFAIADSDFDADRSRVAAGGDARSEAPFAFPTFSVYGEGHSLAVMRVTDLVFSGPGEEVAASLRVVFDGELTEIASNLVDGSLESSMLSRTNVYLGGGICNGIEYMTFSGSHLRTLIDDDDQAPSLAVTDLGVLEDVPLEGATEILVGPFTVPTGESLTFELWTETIVTTSGNGGFAHTAAAFSLALGPLGGGAIFDLPEGYTTNSPTAGIVANIVPESGAGFTGLAAIVALAAIGRRRAASAIRPRPAWLGRG